MNTVASQVMRDLSTLRKHINDTPPVNWHLSQDRSRWLRATSALDVAEDTEIAISHTHPAISERGDVGEKYLWVYGLLQCMYVQQDSLIAISRCMEGLKSRAGSTHQFQRSDYPEWQDVRTVRNETIGHPAETNTPPTVHGLVRVTLSFEAFSYLSAELKGPSRSTSISIAELKKKQAAGAGRILARLISLADKTHTDYQVSISNSDLGFVFNQELVTIVGAISTPNELGPEVLNLVETHIARLRCILREAAGDYRTYYGLQNECDLLIHAVREARRASGEGFVREVKERVVAVHECVQEIMAKNSETRDGNV